MMTKYNKVNYKVTLQDGNRLLSRTILLCFMVACRGGTFMIEQPASSRLPWNPRFEYMLEKIPVYRVGWWMRHYGSLTPNLCWNVV